MKCVCEELEEGLGSLRLRHKSFQQRVIHLEVEKGFNDVFFTFEFKGKVFNDFPLSKSKGKVFDGLIIIIGKKGF